MRNLLPPSPSSSPRKFVLIRPDVKGPLPSSPFPLPPFVRKGRKERFVRRISTALNVELHHGLLRAIIQRSFLSNPWCKIQRLHTLVDKRNRKGNEKKEREREKRTNRNTNHKSPRYR